MRPAIKTPVALVGAALLVLAGLGVPAAPAHAEGRVSIVGPNCVVFDPDVPQARATYNARLGTALRSFERLVVVTPDGSIRVVMGKPLTKAEELDARDMAGQVQDYCAAQAHSPHHAPDKSGALAGGIQM